MSTRFDTIDLSRVPAPAVIETIDYEAMNGAFIEAFVAAAAKVGLAYDVGMLETDPVVIGSEAFAYQRMLDRARVNDAARAVMLAYAVGTDLDNLAALYGVTRMVVTPATDFTLAVMESDERFRARIQLAPEALTTCGTKPGYRFHAFSAHASVTDINVLVPQPGYVDVVVQAGANGEASPEVITAVRNRLLRDDIKPLTVALAVRAATIVPYNVTATLDILRGPDQSMIQANAMASLASYAASRFRVGASVPRSGIIAALSVPGVERVTLASPAADLQPAGDELLRIGTVSLTMTVLG